MSNRQGITKDVEELEKERQLAKNKNQEKKKEQEEERKRLEEVREKAKSKLDAALKSKVKKTPLFNLTPYQWSFLIVGVITVVLVVLPFLGEESSSTSNSVIDQKRIEKINSENKGYKVGPNSFFEGWTLDDAKHNLKGISNSGKFETCGELQIENLPKKFNSRMKHTSCMTPIYDQAKCSSSYAFAVAGMMANRYCISHGGSKKFDASAQHIISCESKGGCHGGDIAQAATTALKKGLVNTICLPYNPERADICDRQRLESCFTLSLKSICTTDEVEQIKRNIYKNGPVVSLLKATSELLVYSSGIYDGAKGRFLLRQQLLSMEAKQSRLLGGMLEPKVPNSGLLRTLGGPAGGLLGL